MSTDNHQEEQRRHELLCAYVLDELEPAQCAEVEALLASSPELREERARLEATIGLVQESLGAGEEALSEESRAKLTAAAQAAGASSTGGGGGGVIVPAPPRRTWYRAPAFRVAVAAGLLLTVTYAWRAFDDAGSPPPHAANEVAMLEKNAKLAGDQSLEAGEKLGRGLASSVEGRREDLERDLEAKRRKQGPLPENAQYSRMEDELGILEEDVASLGELGYDAGATDEWLGLDEEIALRAAELGEQPPMDEARISEFIRAGLEHSSDFKPVDVNSFGASAPEPSGQMLVEPESGVVQPRSSTTIGTVLVAQAPAEAEEPPAAATRGYTHRGRSGTYVGPGDVAPPSTDRQTVTERMSALKDKQESGQGGSNAAAPASEGLSYEYEDSRTAAASKRVVLDAGDNFFLGAGAFGLEVDAALRDRLAGLGVRGIPAEQFAALAWQDQVALVLQHCRRLPEEAPRDMYFRFWGDNAPEYASVDALSTFSIDVDTASYALARRTLMAGHLPAKEQVRTEEFVNYFRPDVPPPTDRTFAIALEMAPSRFGGPEHEMLRVVVRGREVGQQERKPVALTFVVDVSGSMKEAGRIGLVQHALGLLVDQLDTRDALAIVAFSKEARIVLPMTSAANRGPINDAIARLVPEGGTNAEAGLLSGYAQASLSFDPQASNRVVLLSDGVANIGETDQDRINESVARYRDQGIYLNTVGVGMGNHDDDFLEQLADKGDGIANYVDSSDEARRALVENFTGAFEPIARDVKIQVEFDPTQVESYRLLGYENRAIADVDFRNDAVDAGEVGAGHQVAALYEIARTGAHSLQAPLATVRVRYKAPHGETAEGAAGESATEIERSIGPAEVSGSFAGTSPGYRRTVLVAQFAELLRRSEHARGDSLEDLIAEMERLAPVLDDPDFNELIGLAKQAQRLLSEGFHAPDDPLLEAIDALRRNQYQESLARELARDADQELLEKLEKERAELEERIGELLAARETSER